MRRAAVAVFLAACASAGCGLVSGLDSLEVAACGDDCDDGGVDEASDDVTTSHDGNANADGDVNGDGNVSPDTSGDDDVTTGDDGTTGDDVITTGDDANADADAAADAVADAAADAAADAVAVADAVADAPADAGTDAGADTGTDAGVDTGAPDAACPGTTGPTMVRAGSFCIDSTEITVGEYGQFLTAKGSDTSGQPTYCAWNTTYQPSFKQGASDTPANYVDWCDAYMYCKWAGKRLCGAIAGGSSPFASYSNPTVSQWEYACSQNGNSIYPYGNTYGQSTCQGKDAHDNNVEPVGTYAGCVGGYPGIHDMSGSVWEWEDSCTASSAGDAGASDTCRVRGGSLYDYQAFMTCTADSTGFTSPVTRDNSFYNFGFRCCSP